jgi:hypothetical protein
MSTVLICPIGKADLQLLYNKERTRHIADKTGLNSILPGLQFVWEEDYTESREPLHPEPADAVALPRIRKAIKHLRSVGEVEIDYLILISTNRTNELALLEQMEAEASRSPDSAELIKTINSMRIKAEEDPSHDFALKAKELLENNSSSIGIQISEVIVIGLGTGTYLQSLVENGRTVFDVKNFDINRADFFDYELIESLRPHLSMLHNSHIYLTTWGSFPNLHKSLERVLRSILPNSNTTPIHTREDGQNISIELPQSRFLELHRNMNRAAIEMNWEAVSQHIEAIVSQKPGYFDSLQIKDFAILLKGIRDNQKKRDNWFSNFFVLILKALYTQDLNSLHIWIKCLEEAAFMAVLSNADNQKLFSYKLQLNVPLNHHIQGRYGKGSVLEFTDGSKIEAKFREVWRRLSKMDNVKYLREYGRLLYLNLDQYSEYYDYPPNRSYEKLIDRRNKLIHSGIPIQRDEGLYESLMQFIDVGSDQHKEAVLLYKELNWQALQEFEKSVLKGKFFRLMKRIAGIYDPDWLPLDRAVLKQYFAVILR